MANTTRRRRVAPRVRKHQPAGTTPGFYKRSKTKVPVNFKLMSYDQGTFTEASHPSVDSLVSALNGEQINWIAIEGEKDYASVIAIGEHFKFHKLAIEDIIDDSQPAKFEQYANESFFVLRPLVQQELLETSQFSIFVQGKNIVTFQHGPIDAIDRVRDRIRQTQGRIRTAGIDYLVYAIIDAIIDTYFPALEKFAEILDDIDNHLFDCDPKVSMTKIHAIKGELVSLRRIVWGHHDMVLAIQREAPAYFKRETFIFMRDCLDHTKQQLDLAETYREVGGYLMDLAFSNANLKANEIMKVLTIVASIFIPLTFITGIYGMNFNTEVSKFNMPELNWAFGYPFALGLMLAFATSLVLFFRHKKWI